MLQALESEGERMKAKADVPSEQNTRILIVDDNELNRDMLRRRLSRKGYDVEDVDGGIAALDCIADESVQNFDMVLLDVNMPDMDGIAVLTRLRETYSTIELPIIMVTARAESDLIGEALELGANDYITKPLDMKVALARIRTHLSVKAAAHEVSSMSSQLALDNASRINVLLESIGEAVVMSTDNGVIESINRVTEEMFGYSSDELVGCSVNELLPENLHAAHIQHMDSYLNRGDHNSLLMHPREAIARRKSGETFPVELNLNEMHISGRRMFTAVIRDITERREKEQTIENLAMIDSLTGLANRFQFNGQLEQAVKSAARDGKKFGVLFMDLDRFKEVNDTFGHDVGDELLKVVGARLHDSLRDSDAVARLGGDEFAMVLTNLDSEQDLYRPLETMLENMRKPIKLGTYEHRALPSIGISVFPDNSKEAGELVRMADVALYEAKNEGGNGYRFYDNEMDSQVKRRKLLVDALRHALEVDDEISLVYQPQFDLREGRWIGVEALARWNHPDMGFISPEEFIPLAEHSSLIHPLGKLVLEEACKTAAEWVEQGLRDFKMAVNISAMQLKMDNFVETVIDVRKAANLPAEYLELEITEGMVMHDMEGVVKKLVALKEDGITTAIDDFGTGYSSLSYLKKLPVDRLKIDRSFIMDIPHDTDDVSITKAIISMGTALGLEIVAEGVEEKNHMSFLEDQGCGIGQGYFLGKPMGAAEAINVMTGAAPS